MPMPAHEKEIKIFVSRRVDVDSAAVPNPLYVPMRCGAALDTDSAPKYAGDDTGDNISEKKARFCEFTVQYWAWKNTAADYCGLCHYRRYLAFSGRTYRQDEHGLVPCAVLSPRTMEKFGLLDADAMRREIEAHDLVIPSPAPVQNIPLPRGRAHTVRELWEAHDGLFFDKKIIDRLFTLIDETAPEYSASAREYFAGDLHRGYNCYVMRRELFDRLCRFQFPIIEAMDREFGSGAFPRSPGYAGEMLFGVFLHHVLTRETWRACEKPLVLFMETEAAANPAKLIWWYIVYGMDRIVRAVAAPFFPLGSARREKLKAIYRKLTRSK